jgi:hypothetical protein
MNQSTCGRIWSTLRQAGAWLSPKNNDTMNKPSYRQLWRSHCEAEYKGFLEIIAKDRFHNWENNSGPEETAERDLFLGVELLYAQLDPALARQYIERSLTILKRIFDENRCEYLDHGFPMNRGEALRTAAYARALLGEPLDTASFSQASRDIETHCRGTPPNKLCSWDAVTQTWWLSAVRLSLLAGDVERARNLLQHKKSFKSVKLQYDALAALGAAAPPLPIVDPKVREQFEVYFDAVRNPNYQYPPDQILDSHKLVMFELGLLRDKYFISPDGTIDFHRAIDAVSY